MPRSIGYNVIGWNEAPWAKSGYYPATDSLTPAFNVTAPVGDSQALAFNITNPVADSQAVDYEIRQIAADSQTCEFSVVSIPAGNSVAPEYDVTNPSPDIAIQIAFGVGLSVPVPGAVIARQSGFATLARRTGDASLSRTG